MEICNQTDLHLKVDPKQELLKTKRGFVFQNLKSKAGLILSRMPLPRRVLAQTDWLLPPPFLFLGITTYFLVHIKSIQFLTFKTLLLYVLESSHCSVGLVLLICTVLLQTRRSCPKCILDEVEEETLISLTSYEKEENIPQFKYTSSACAQDSFHEKYPLAVVTKCHLQIWISCL